jgi:hypothetical protein
MELKAHELAALITHQLKLNYPDPDRIVELALALKETREREQAGK